MDWTSIFQSKAADHTGRDRWQLQFDDSIEEDQQNYGWKQYIKRTWARFQCSLCRRTWPSNHVTVLFHMHLDSHTHRGTVKVRRFKQNCKQCQHAPMEKPSIETHCVEFLMENLVKNIRKKFYHEIFDEVPWDHAGVEVESPHEPDHCEGCMAGVCIKGADSPRRHGYRPY